MRELLGKFQILLPTIAKEMAELDLVLMLWQSAAVGPSFCGAFAAFGWACFMFRGLDRGDRLLHIFEREGELVGVQLFGRPTILGVASHAAQARRRARP